MENKRKKEKIRIEICYCWKEGILIEIKYLVRKRGSKEIWEKIYGSEKPCYDVDVLPEK